MNIRRYNESLRIQTLVRASQGVDWSWSQCIKSHHAQTSSGTTSEASYLGCGEKELDCCSVVQSPLFRWKYILHFIWKSRSGVWRLERHRIQAAWNPVWSFWSQWWFGVPWRLLVLVCCVLSSPNVNAATYQEILEHFMLPSADKLYGDADFLFQQDFSTCPHCQNHFQVVCWPWNYCAWLASQHAWPEPHMESMGYFQEKDEKQSIQQSRRAEGSIVSQQSHRLIASMPHFTDAGVCAKGAPAKYWVHKWTYFKEL